MKALVVIDIQREYIAPGRKFQIQSIGPSLKNAYAMLHFARCEGWPIVHVQHLQDGDLFNRIADTSDFIDGFVPESSEALAVKGNYSSFSSPEFEQFAAAHAEHEFVVVGYGSTMCCLATIVDGYHRGYRFALVEDACAARAARNHSEASMHEHAMAILEPFARLTRADVEIAGHQPLAA
ncbi:putative isochorismatase family protein YddQ [Jeongeupia sp. HS-3]|uniref:cysteine hydrolase family protein n=1 Tax=Jeongeupia sp. HS-3 TaxID=1009682 RepID=UPI0018A35790|nr:cysteine hydrolase [Jeongeupia sp. HS-3]BCL74707.1 putative isochorismatase family protein YddQ [Jeongeupia sp. HS-3]